MATGKAGTRSIVTVEARGAGLACGSARTQAATCLALFAGEVGVVEILAWLARCAHGREAVATLARRVAGLARIRFCCSEEAGLALAARLAAELVALNLEGLAVVDGLAE